MWIVRIFPEFYPAAFFLSITGPVQAGSFGVKNARISGRNPKNAFLEESALPVFPGHNGHFTAQRAQFFHNGNVGPVKNPHWKMPIPQPRMMRVRENPALGIMFNNPVYAEFIKRPRVFGYLENPVSRVDEIMDMLVDE